MVFLKPNAIYLSTGGGTAVISATAYGLINRTLSAYSDKIGTLYSAVGGMRGAIHEDLTDVFGYASEDGVQNAEARINRLKFYPSPVFGMSRYEPDSQDCDRLMDIFTKRNIHFVFINDGNDAMQKALMLKEQARLRGYEMHVVGIPKTVDNDLLVTHRSPGYMSFAKQVALDSMSLAGDLDSFTIPRYAWLKGPIKEGAVAQIMVKMGRDQGWGVAPSLIGQRSESDGPHVVLTKEGGFSIDAFLDRAQRAWDRFGKLFIVAAEGAHDGHTYLGNYTDVSVPNLGIAYKTHTDPCKNTSVTDSRLGLFLKLLIENKLNIPANVYKDLKAREEGPDYVGRSDLEILSAVDFHDAILVGGRAADLAFGGSSPIDGIMVTLTHNIGEAGYTPLEEVANLEKGSKKMVKSIRVLDTPEKSIISPDGLMIDKELFVEYAEPFIDLNGPNRSELLRAEGFRLPLPKINWTLEERLLPPYQKVA